MSLSFTQNILQSKATSRPGHPAAGLRYFVCIMKGAVSTCRVDRNSVRTLYLEFGKTLVWVLW